MACQSPFREIDPIDLEATVAKDSETYELIRRVLLLDGSADDLVDQANCAQIIWPVTVQVGATQYTLQDQASVTFLSNTLLMQGQNPASVDILFPIQVRLPDYSTETLASPAELEALQGTCVMDGSDEDIECVDFVYPLTVFVYHPTTEVADNQSVDSDEDLFELLDGLDSEALFSFEFPLTVEGEVPTVLANHEALGLWLAQNEQGCSEEDSLRWDFEAAPLVQALLAHPWPVSLWYDEVLRTEVLSSHPMVFTADGKVAWGDVVGTWETDTDPLELTLDFDSETELNELDLNWEVKRVSETELIMEHLSGGVSSSEFLVLATAPIANPLADILQGSAWGIARFIEDGTDNTEEVAAYVFQFGEDLSLSIDDQGDLIEATWVAVSDLRLILDIEESPYDDLRDQWQVVSYSATEVVLVSPENHELRLVNR